MPLLFDHYPNQRVKDQCQNACIILQNSHKTSSSFLDIFEKEYRDRGGRGVPTDEEQDLLRAMLTNATAGLDATVKQLVRDALPSVVDHVTGASKNFQGFIERKLGRGEEIDTKFIAITSYGLD